MSRISLQEFLTRFECKAEDILRRMPVDANVLGYNDTVFTTWEISFSAVQEMQPAAADLLTMCSFLSNEDIWEGLIARYGTLHGKRCYYSPSVSVSNIYI
jgi:hypothetical protein